MERVSWRAGTISAVESPKYPGRTPTIPSPNSGRDGYADCEGEDPYNQDEAYYESDDMNQHYEL